MSHDSIAKLVRLNKEKHPELYCKHPECLYRTETALGHRECPKHINEFLPLAVKCLKELDAKKPFEAIAFRGMSGALTAVLVAHVMGKELIMCRKEGEDNHSGRAVEGYTAANNYVIVDDIISSGATVAAIQRMVSVFSPKAKCIAMLEWIRLDQVGYELDRPESWHYDPNMRYDIWGKSLGVRS